MRRRPREPRQRDSTRLLVVLLVVQLLLAALIIWAAATGFSVVRGWL